MKKQIRKRKKISAPKKCYFCEEKKQPNFLETEVLGRFTTERGKIIGRVRSGLCAKHQRRVTSAVKHARHLALMPFVTSI